MDRHETLGSERTSLSAVARGTHVGRSHGRGVGGQGPDGPFSAFAGEWFERIAPCPWPALGGSSSLSHGAARRTRERLPLYTPDERARRDSSIWTLVQAILAPLQFLVFIISAGLVVRYLTTGAGLEIAATSVVIKTVVLYTIMITGSIWEKEVFGKWLFARPFFWEDVFSMLVLALHTAYLAAVAFHWGTPTDQMILALAAYATYVINAGQFLWKLRAARLESATAHDSRLAGAAG